MNFRNELKLSSLLLGVEMGQHVALCPSLPFQSPAVRACTSNYTGAACVDAELSPKSGFDALPFPLPPIHPLTVHSQI